MNRIGWALLSLLVLGGSGMAAWLLYETRPEAAEVERERPIVEVDVVRAHVRDNPIVVTAMGEVQAAHKLIVQPEVGGRVRARSESLIPGGLVAAGDPLVRIDARDISAAVAAQQAAVAQAKVQLADERGRKDVAAAEWGGRADKLGEDARNFALRDPHIKSAKASLGSASLQLSKARRDLARASIKAPFDALVLDAPVEVGQIVAQTSQLATLVDTDHYWVQVAVPVNQLEYLVIPAVNVNGRTGSLATVVHDAGSGVEIERIGYIERLEGSVNVRGRMARLLIAVDDPLDLKKPAGERGLPLLLGSYVKVALTGRPAKDTIALPREAVRGGKVWLVVDGKLLRQDVDVIRRSRDGVLVRGLTEGDAVVTTPLAAPTEGMEVKVRTEDSGPGVGTGAEQTTVVAATEVDEAALEAERQEFERLMSSGTPEDLDEAEKAFRRIATKIGEDDPWMRANRGLLNAARERVVITVGEDDPADGKRRRRRARNKGGE